SRTTSVAPQPPGPASGGSGVKTARWPSSRWQADGCGSIGTTIAAGPASRGRGRGNGTRSAAAAVVTAMSKAIVGHTRMGSPQVEHDCGFLRAHFSLAGACAFRRAGDHFAGTCGDRQPLYCPALVTGG